MPIRGTGNNGALEDSEAVSVAELKKRLGLDDTAAPDDQVLKLALAAKAQIARMVPGFWCRQPRDLAIMGYGASQN